MREALRSDRTRRVARRAAVVLGVIALVLVGVVAGLLAHPAGARFVLNAALERSPLTVSVSSVEGSLRGPLSLAGVDVEHLGLRLHADRVVLDWRILPLLRRQLRVDSLQVSGVTAFVPEGFRPSPETDEEEGPSREGPPTVPDLPVQIHVAAARIGFERVTMEGRGEVRGAQLDASGSLEDFAVDFRLVAEGAPLETLNAHGSIRGSPDDYQIGLTTNFVSAGLPRVDLSLDTRGSLSEMSIDSLRVVTENGSAMLQAQLGWYPYPVWSVTADARLLDVAALTPNPEEWPGSVSFSARSEGRLDGSTIVADAHVERLSGDLRGESLAGEIHVDVRSPSVVLDAVDVRWGEIVLAANGAVEIDGATVDTADVRFVVTVPDLGQALPGATGRLEVDGELRGSGTSPRVLGSFDVEALSLGSTTVDRAGGRMDVSVQPQARSLLAVRAGAIEASGVVIDSVALELDGTGSEHVVRFDAWAPAGAIGLLAGGTLSLPEAVDSVPSWVGRLDSLSVGSTEAGRWVLERPAPVFASADSVSLGRACVLREGTGACLSGARSRAGRIDGVVDVDAVPLEAIPVKLPDGIEVAGALGADVAFTVLADGALRARGTATAEGTASSVASEVLPIDTEGVASGAAPADTAHFTFGGEGVRFVIDSLGARGDAGGFLRSDARDGLIEVALRAEIPGLTSIHAAVADQPLAATVSVGSDDVAFLAPLTPGVDSLGGRFSLEADISRDGADAGDVHASFEAAQLRVDSATVDQMAAQIDLSLHPGVPNRIVARADRIAIGGTAVDSLTLDLDGVVSGHVVQIGAWLPGGAAELVASGALGVPDAVDSLPRWEGRLDSLSVESVESGRWLLREPAGVFASADSISLSRACVLRDGTGVCVAGVRNGAGRIDGDANIAALPLAALPLPLGRGMSIDGQVDGDVDFTMEADGELRADGTLTAAGTLAAPAAGSVQRFEFGGDGLRFSVDSLGARGEARLSLRSDPPGGLFEVSFQGELPGLTSTRAPLEGQPLEGRLVVVSEDLSFMAALAPMADSLGGRFSLDVAGSGTVDAPRLRGTVQLADGFVELPAAGLRISDVTLSAEAAEAGGITIEGSARSGEGSLTIEGRSPIEPTSDRQAVLSIEGGRFRALNVPELQLDVAPDLDLRFDGSTVFVEGVVAVPWARAELLEVPASAVAPSADVVIVDEEPVVPPRVEANVQLTVGNDVRFSGLGFTSFIEGDLRVREVPGAPPTVLGELRFVNGRYRAYGQDLEIDPGRVTFSGPVEDAALDVTAARTASDGTVAGLEVSGLVTSPDVTLFSDPAMADADALSYILYGKPLSDGSASEQGQVAGAAATLGANVLTTRLASEVGLDDARIEGTTRDQAELVAGKYLSPSIYVSYGVGLFKSSSTFRIKYLLNSNWALQAESGDANGGDLLYQIERGR